MPRLLRLAAYGSGHQEVDMTGAHYEIVRRSIEKCSLPPIQKLRELLRSEWSRTGCVDFDEAIKLWPLCVINGGMQAADDQLRRQQLVTTPAINAIAYELTAACAAFTTSVLPCLRSRLPTCFRNRAFFATEYVECMAMQIFLVQLQQRVTLRSVIWLHDGVWIPSEVEERDIRFAESVMLQAFSVRSEGETLLHVCQLDPYAEQAIQLYSMLPLGETLPQLDERTPCPNTHGTTLLRMCRLSASLMQTMLNILSDKRRDSVMHSFQRIFSLGLVLL